MAIFVEIKCLFLSAMHTHGAYLCPENCAQKVSSAVKARVQPYSQAADPGTLGTSVFTALTLTPGPWSS